MINKYFINIYSGYFFYYYDIFNVKYNTKTINFKFIKKVKFQLVSEIFEIFIGQTLSTIINPNISAEILNSEMKYAKYFRE